MEPCALRIVAIVGGQVKAHGGGSLLCFSRPGVDILGPINLGTSMEIGIQTNIKHVNQAINMESMETCRFRHKHHMKRVDPRIKHGIRHKKQEDLSQKHEYSKKNAKEIINHVTQAKRKDEKLDEALQENGHGLQPKSYIHTPIPQIQGIEPRKGRWRV